MGILLMFFSGLYLFVVLVFGTVGIVGSWRLHTKKFHRARLHKRKSHGGKFAEAIGYMCRVCLYDSGFGVKTKCMIAALLCPGFCVNLLGIWQKEAIWKKCHRESALIFLKQTCMHAKDPSFAFRNFVAAARCSLCQGISPFLYNVN